MVTAAAVVGQLGGGGGRVCKGEGGQRGKTTALFY